MKKIVEANLHGLMVEAEPDRKITEDKKQLTPVNNKYLWLCLAAEEEEVTCEYVLPGQPRCCKASLSVRCSRCLTF